MDYKVMTLCLWFLTLLGRSISIHNNTGQDTLEFGARLRKLTNRYQARQQVGPMNISAIHAAITNVPSNTSARDVTPINRAPNSSNRVLQRTDKWKLAPKPIRGVNRVAANDGKIQNDKLSSASDEKSDDKKQSLLHLPNLQLNRIEPFWPFSNITSTYLINNLKINDGRNNGFHQHVNNNNLPERFKDTTFFFSHIGPNSFEYRAQFHHNQDSLHQPKEFNPFVNEFPEFPKFPTLNFPDPTFPDPPEILQQKPRLPVLPEFKHFPFTPFFPPVKEISTLHHEGPIEVNYPQNIQGFNEPLSGHKKRNAIGEDLGIKYPKIFKFNDERINIEEFERQKKTRMKLKALNSNQISEPENVQRSQLLILHGGIFTVKEPPLYHRKVVRKRRQRLRNNRNQIANY